MVASAAIDYGAVADVADPKGVEDRCVYHRSDDKPNKQTALASNNKVDILVIAERSSQVRDNQCIVTPCVSCVITNML